MYPNSFLPLLTHTHHLSIFPPHSCQVVTSFYPPSGFSNGITQYTVQWDTVSTFVHAISGGASCTTSGYGSCAVTGVAIQGVPPFSYQIERVSVGVTYYVRVSARNSISTQAWHTY